MIDLSALKKNPDHPYRQIFKPYSKPQIAKLIGCSPSHLRSILNGNVNPGPELMFKLDKLVSEIKMQEGRADA